MLRDDHPATDAAGHAATHATVPSVPAGRSTAHQPTAERSPQAIEAIPSADAAAHGAAAAIAAAALALAATIAATSITVATTTFPVATAAAVATAVGLAVATATETARDSVPSCGATPAPVLWRDRRQVAR